MSFIETRFLDQFIGLGSGAGPEYSTDITELQSGRENRNQAWSYPRHRYALRIAAGTSSKIEALRQLHHSTKGRFNGFRFKDFNDYSSAASMDVDPAYDDQYIDTGDGTTLTFQLIKTYESGTESQVRTITKPTSGSTIIGITEASATPSYSVQDSGDRWSVSTTTGVLTFSANVSLGISNAVSSGSNTIITVASTGLVTGQTALFSTFTGDWAGINGIRYQLTRLSGTSFSFPHNSSAYAAYSSNAGQLDTIPQTGEYIVAGYDFDVPVRFNSDSIIIEQISPGIEQSNIELIEIK